MQYELTKVTRERDALNNRVEWSEKELLEKNNEYLKIRREMNDKINYFETQFNTLQNENQRLVEKEHVLEVIDISQYI